MWPCDGAVIMYQDGSVVALPWWCHRVGDLVEGGCTSITIMQCTPVGE